LGHEANGSHRRSLDPSKIHGAAENFNNETVDLVHVSERIQAAFGYFLKPMDELVLKSCGN
jgi:hypothetical protein